MPRKKKEILVQFNKDYIIQAAKTLFVQKGIASTTVDEIAREADCSKSTMYVYFTGKEDIINHIIYEQMAVLRDIIFQCINSEEDYKKCFFLICQKLVAFQKEYPVYYELLLSEIEVSQEDIQNQNIKGKIYVVGEQINDVIGEALENGIKKGIVRRDIELIPTIFYLWSGISQIVKFGNQKETYFKCRIAYVM